MNAFYPGAAKCTATTALRRQYFYSRTPIRFATR
jgi:hypothetical protein